MRRRDFLRGLTGGINDFASKDTDELQSEPKGTLKKFSGEWDFRTSAHLMRRVMFGASKADIEWALAKGLSSSVDELIRDQPIPDPPVYHYKDDSGIEYGKPFHESSFSPNDERKKVNSILAWWLDKILYQPRNITEKMVLFWHNHFVTESIMVYDSRYTFKYIDLLRRNALGNFKQLASAITIDPSMLKYLNGNTNSAGQPNENYARELLELFTVGKGEYIGPGNYTNYTEDDVIAAAKVLTGWRDNRINFTSFYTGFRHDKSTKKFSSAFSNSEIKNNEDKEYLDLINMIFQQKAASEYICTKLYRWIVFSEISENTYQNIIVPLAEILRENDFEIKSVLKTLLESEHFYDIENQSCMIKNPIEFVAGTMRLFELNIPNRSNYEVYYNLLLNSCWANSAIQGLILADPPSVAGWPAYYQEGIFYRLWESSVTMQYKNLFTDLFIQTGIRYRANAVLPDLIAFAAKLEKPVDIDDLINDSVKILLAVEINAAQKQFLRDAVLDGMPDYEWSGAWIQLSNDPNDSITKKMIEGKLKTLFRFILSSAEYHLQ